MQGNFYFIPPYGVNGRCIIFGPMVYRAFFFYSAIRCKWSVYNLWPYGVEGIFIFLIPPYGVNGRFCSLALWCTGHFYFLIPPYGVNGWCIIFGPMVYRAFLFLLFRHTV